MNGMNKFEEHLYKEVLKRIVDGNDRYPQSVKDDLKQIVDSAHSFEELFESMLIYFAGKRSNMF